MMEVAEATFADFPDEVARRFPLADITLRRSGTGITVRFPSGWTMSVQTGPAMYNDHRFRDIDLDRLDALWLADGDTPSGRYFRETTRTAEIAVYINDGPLLPIEGGDTVAGWVKRNDVLDLLGLLATLPPNLTPAKVNWQLRSQRQGIIEAEYREIEP